MSESDFIKRHTHVGSNFAVILTSLLVGAYGVYIIADALLVQVFAHHMHRFDEAASDLLIDIPILFGLSVIYVSSLLRRRKRTAWTVAVLAFVFYMGLGLSQLLNRNNVGHFHHLFADIFRVLILPAFILLMLYVFRKEFVVKSDIQGFRFALRFIVIILMVTLIYGVAGFMLMDDSDFHEEIGPLAAVHYTIDQFNLTTSKPVHPYTRRAKLFTDSLSFISLVSIVYIAFSLFQPLKSRFSDQRGARERVEALLNKYGAPSEEFFKLWPHDKQYFFDESNESAVAFHVFHGVALCLSDPIGNPLKFPELLQDFSNLCFSNDWLPSFIHVADTHIKLYKKQGFSVQKLGQEAVVGIDHFEETLRDSKYFRQILNKFNNQGYKYELLKPPHHKAVIERLKSISEEWLSKGGRAERGFALGYYTDAYMEMCEVAVARDAAGTIQAFMNLIPAEFDHEEATYDLIRQSNRAPGNVSDFLLINTIHELKQRGFTRLNLGLSPLAGLKEEENEKQPIIDNVLKFAYANGDMFFSFSGLHRFKSKYEPEWQAKYVVYKGGIRGFSRTMTALTRCMSKVVSLD